MLLKGLKVAIVASSLLLSNAFAEETPPAPPEIPATATVAKDATTGASNTISYKVKFKEGWTLFGLPGYKAYKVKDILGDKSNIDIIYYYNNEKVKWELFQPRDAQGNITVMSPGVGYWVNSLKPFVVEFKSNIVSSIKNYEKAAVLKPKEGTTDLSDANLLPPMPIETASYEDMWSDAGEFKTDFAKDAGTIDWDTRKPEDFTAADWEESFRFDAPMLIDHGFTDTDGLKARFRPTKDFRKMTVDIITTSGKTISGEAIINQKGHLQIDYFGTAEVKSVIYQLLDIEEAGAGKFTFKMKNVTDPANVKAVKWTVAEFYNPKTMTWGDSQTVFGFDEAKDDKDLGEIDWDNIGTQFKDIAFDEIEGADFVPKCRTSDGTEIELPQNADGSYPFPGDPTFPAECNIVQHDIISTGLEGKAPTCLAADGTEITLVKKADGTYPFPGDPEFPAECKPLGDIKNQLQQTTASQDPSAPTCTQPDGTVVTLTQRADGSYPLPGDADYPTGCNTTDTSTDSTLPGSE